MIADRIRQIMEVENLTPARFADNLEVGRAVISHIMNGRNNPSLDIITRILNKMPQINSDWLLTGNGNMFKFENDVEHKNILSNNQASYSPDLFSQEPQKPLENSANPTDATLQNEYRKENTVHIPEKEVQEIINERIIYKEAPSKKIRQIIIYYSDNTFETFTTN